MNAAEMMLVLKALAPGASLKFSEYTSQWYVEAAIEIGNGAIVTGGSEHRDSPDEAIRAYFDRLAYLPSDHYVITRYCGHRREWRWNGAAFAEATRPVALPEPKVTDHV